MQVNLNSNSAIKFGCYHSFSVPKANKVVKKLGPKFEEAVSETIPTLNLLNNRAKIKIKICKGKDVNLNGFAIEVSPIKSGLQRLFRPSEDTLNECVLAKDEIIEGKKLSEIMIDKIVEMVNSINK